MIEIWTDGSSKLTEGQHANTKQRTGMGLVVFDHRLQPVAPATAVVGVEHSAFLDQGTNNTAELAAIIYALELFATEPNLPLTIHTDSQYCKGAAGLDAVNNNGDLIYHLRGMIGQRNPPPVIHKVAAHVRGSGGDPINARADELAGIARAAGPSKLPPRSSVLFRLLKLPGYQSTPHIPLPDPLPRVDEAVPSLSSTPLPAAVHQDQERAQQEERTEQR